MLFCCLIKNKRDYKKANQKLLYSLFLNLYFIVLR
nr:MAG TPA: hypothetical protein [Caudoviricetes sp.]